MRPETEATCSNDRETPRCRPTDTGRVESRARGPPERGSRWRHTFHKAFSAARQARPCFLETTRPRGWGELLTRVSLGRAGFGSTFYAVLGRPEGSGERLRIDLEGLFFFGSWLGHLILERRFDAGFDRGFAAHRFSENACFFSGGLCFFRRSPSGFFFRNFSGGGRGCFSTNQSCKSPGRPSEGLAAGLRRRYELVGAWRAAVAGRARPSTSVPSKLRPAPRVSVLARSRGRVVGSGIVEQQRFGPLQDDEARARAAPSRRRRKLSMLAGHIFARGN